MKTRFVVVLLVLLLGAATLVNAQSSSSAGPVVRRQAAELIATNHKNVGEVEFWNTRYNFNVVVQPAGDWVVREVQLYAGKELPPISKNGKPDLRNFNCIRKTPRSSSL